MTGMETDLLYRGNDGPVRISLKHLLGGPGVNGNGIHTGVFGHSGDVQGLFAGFIPSGPDLDGQRNADGASNRTENGLGLENIPHQGRTGAGLEHFFDRAPEVDIQDVGPGCLDHCRSLRHHERIGSEDLDGKRLFFRNAFQHGMGFAGTIDQTV